MADNHRKKPRLSRLSPESKIRAKERRKETLREYGQSRHIIRLSGSTWTEWNHFKTESNASTHDEFAVQLLQAWAVRRQIQERKGLVIDKTPSKFEIEGLEVPSTPVVDKEEVEEPSFPVSEISDSNGGAVRGQVQDRKVSVEESLVMEETPSKSKIDGLVLDPTPVAVKEEVVDPSFPVSDISDSNGGISGISTSPILLEVKKEKT